MPTETEMRLTGATVLHVSFDDGTAYALPAEYLRVESPSAEVQGHHPGQKQMVAGRRHVGIIGIEPVGHYAVRLVFDDLHDTGIFSWDYLANSAGSRIGAGRPIWMRWPPAACRVTRRGCAGPLVLIPAARRAGSSCARAGRSLAAQRRRPAGVTSSGHTGGPSAAIVLCHGPVVCQRSPANRSSLPAGARAAGATETPCRRARAA